jgi:hypothetical protein
MKYPKIKLIKKTNSSEGVLEVLDSQIVTPKGQDGKVRTSGELVGRALFLDKARGNWKIVLDDLNELCLICVDKIREA